MENERSAAINIGGTEYELILTTRATKEIAKRYGGLENLGEGSQRCFNCYEFRLIEAAKICKEFNMDYFVTTLSISPYKNAEKINEIGKSIGREYGVKHLPSDFKKKNGYKRSIELSHEYDLYRQNYCGCIYSRREASNK